MAQGAIRPAEPGDEVAWRGLWRDYTALFDTSLSEDMVALTWRRILDPEHPIGCLMALEGETRTGFLHYILHPRTWSERDKCYMEDLYVMPEARLRNAGSALCYSLRNLCLERRVSCIYWRTDVTNLSAQAFYDRFCPRDPSVHYVMPLP